MCHRHAGAGIEKHQKIGTLWAVCKGILPVFFDLAAEAENETHLRMDNRRCISLKIKFGIF